MPGINPLASKLPLPPCKPYNLLHPFCPPGSLTALTHTSQRPPEGLGTSCSSWPRGLTWPYPDRENKQACIMGQHAAAHPLPARRTGCLHVYGLWPAAALAHTCWVSSERALLIPCPGCLPMAASRGAGGCLRSGAAEGRPGPLGIATTGAPDPQDWLLRLGLSLTTNRQVQSRRMCGWGSWAGGRRGLRAPAAPPSTPLTVAMGSGGRGLAPHPRSRTTAALSLALVGTCLAAYGRYKPVNSSST